MVDIEWWSNIDWKSLIKNVKKSLKKFKNQQKSWFQKWDKMVNVGKFSQVYRFVTIKKTYVS